MKTIPMLLSAILGSVTAGVAFAAGAGATTDARVEVIFSQPEKFTDVRDAYTPTEKGRDAILEQIRDFIIAEAGSRVAEGQKLTVTFADIDMAGEFEPWRGSQATDVRVVKDVYPPRMDLEFKLTGADGRVVKEGKRQLRDLAFMMKLSIRHNDALHYEKALLGDWLSDEFPRGKKG
jgi:hypothetical protein